MYFSNILEYILHYLKFENQMLSIKWLTILARLKFPKNCKKKRTKTILIKKLIYLVVKISYKKS